MDLKKLQKIIVSALEDIKGRDIEVIDTRKLTSLFERIIIATGDSNRQVKALARNVQEKVSEAGGEIISTEGEDNGEWVLVDLGDIVVHVMQPAVRAHYALEELWAGRPAPRKDKKVAEQNGQGMEDAEDPEHSERSEPSKRSGRAPRTGA